MRGPVEQREFYGHKLWLARTFRGWNQARLAEACALTQAFISLLEKGAKSPSQEALAALAAALRFDVAFFEEPATDLFNEDACNFRRRKRTPATVRERLVAHGNLFNMVVRYLDGALRLPKVAVPSAQAGTAEAIERAADRCRLEWGVGLNLPCTNMLRVAEKHGVVATRFVGEALDVDAFSRAGSRPLIVLNSDKGSTSRARWDVAHEVGHLVLHAATERLAMDDVEAEADAFAGAFLLPRDGFAREFPQASRIDWSVVFRMKRRWKVSGAAIVRRAHDLRRIDAAEYRRAFKYMSSMGWRSGPEPEEPPEEVPATVALAFEVLHKRFHEDAANVARRIGISADVMRSIGVAVSAVPVEPPREASVVPFRRA